MLTYNFIIMTINLQKLKFLSGFLALTLIFGCSSDSTEDNTEVDLSNQESDFEVLNETFYMIPSPESMFAFTQDDRLVFSGDVLNSTSNTDKYLDTKSKELNFGIYSADLAYVASFDKYQETIDYLGTVRALSDEIELSQVFDQSLMSRIDNIIEDKDSLLEISSDTYMDIVRYLERNERDETLALIVTGGWLESMYIVTNLVGNFNEQNPTIQLIADQKLIFENLILYLQQNKEHENVASTLVTLEPINNVFSRLERVQIESTQDGSDESQIVVGGNTRIQITTEQFEELKQAIKKVRNAITGNNV